VTGAETTALVAAGVALVVAVAAAVRAFGLSRKLTAIPKGGDVFEAIRGLDHDLTQVESAVTEMRPVLESLSRRMPGAIRHAAVVAYDAHGDQAGRLSRSIALLNERHDGLVITLLAGRQETLFFSKMIRKGIGAEQLSPEEQAAVDQAAGL
jgi:hypothetical protein